MLYINLTLESVLQLSASDKLHAIIRVRRKNNGPPDRQEETHKKYIIHFTEIQFSPVLPSSAQFCPVFPSFIQFSSVLLSFSSNFTQFHPVSPSFAQFCPVLPSFPQFLPVLPSFAQFCPVSRKLFQFLDFAVISFPLFCLTFFVHVLAVRVPNCPYHSGIAHFYKFTFMTRCSFSIQRCNHFKRCHHAANPTITRDPHTYPKMKTTYPC